MGGEHELNTAAAVAGHQSCTERDENTRGSEGRSSALARSSDRETDRETDRGERQTDRQGDRQADRQTDSRTNRRTDRQTDRETGRQGDRLVFPVATREDLSTSTLALRCVLYFAHTTPGLRTL